MLVSDLLFDAVRTVHGASLDAAAIAGHFAALREQGGAWLAQQAGGLAPEFEYYADVRYRGQSFDVATLLDPEAAETGDLDRLAAAFHREHAHLFGHAHPGAAIEIISLRLRTRGSLPRPDDASTMRGGAGGVAARRRPARFDGRWHDTPVYDWNELPAGWRCRGPTLIAQETATVVVPPAFSVVLGALGDLVMERN